MFFLPVIAPTERHVIIIFFSQAIIDLKICIETWKILKSGLPPTKISALVQLIKTYDLPT